MGYLVPTGGDVKRAVHPAAVEERVVVEPFLAPNGHPSFLAICMESGVVTEAPVFHGGTLFIRADRAMRMAVHHLGQQCNAKHVLEMGHPR